jgi:hypothetical protein
MLGNIHLILQIYMYIHFQVERVNEMKTVVTFVIITCSALSFSYLS